MKTIAVLSAVLCALLLQYGCSKANANELPRPLVFPNVIFMVYGDTAASHRSEHVQVLKATTHEKIKSHLATQNPQAVEDLELDAIQKIFGIDSANVVWTLFTVDGNAFANDGVTIPDIAYTLCASCTPDNVIASLEKQLGAPLTLGTIEGVTFWRINLSNHHDIFSLVGHWDICVTFLDNNLILLASNPYTLLNQVALYSEKVPRNVSIASTVELPQDTLARCHFPNIDGFLDTCLTELQQHHLHAIPHVSTCVKALTTLTVDIAIVPETQTFHAIVHGTCHTKDDADIVRELCTQGKNFVLQALGSETQKIADAQPHITFYNRIDITSSDNVVHVTLPFTARDVEKVIDWHFNRTEKKEVARR